MSNGNSGNPGNLPAQQAQTAQPALPIDPNTGLVQVQSYTVDQAQQEAAEAEKAKSKGTWFKFKQGPNVVRVLPSVDPHHPSPFRVRWRHWIDLPGGESVKFNCPKHMGGGHCSICAQSDAYKANESTRQKGWKMAASRRGLAVVIDRHNPDKGPQIMDMPGTKVYDPVVSMRQDPRAGGDFTDPMSGFDLIIKRTGGSQQDTDYTVVADRNNSQLADTVEQMNEWLQAQPDLAPYMQVPTDDEVKDMIKKALTGDGQDQAQGAAPAAAPQIGGQVQQQAPAQQQVGAAQTAETMVHDTSRVPQDPNALSADDIPF